MKVNVLAIVHGSSSHLSTVWHTIFYFETAIGKAEPKFRLRSPMTDRKRVWKGTQQSKISHNIWAQINDDI